jgi:hypothetical protein
MANGLLIAGNGQALESSRPATQATPAFTRTAWTPERVAELRRLWAENRGGAYIAKQLGGCTRNGVHWKARRLGLKRPGIHGPSPF